MKLTKSMRDAFVRAVMQDVPKVDYTADVHKLIVDDNLAGLPPEVRKIAESSALRPYLKMTSFYPGNNISSVAVYTQDSWGCYEPSAECSKQVQVLLEKSHAQAVQRQTLEHKVRGVIESCSTLRQAKERLPEFVKYLPEEVEKSKNLPAIANLVADLTQLGWPKNKQPEAQVA